MQRSTYDDDPFLKELLDDALFPFVELLTPDELRAIRDELADAARFHPVGARLVRDARPDPAVQRSDEVPAAGEPAAAEPAAANQSSRRAR
jgi:hypothetical protein